MQIQDPRDLDMAWYADAVPVPPRQRETPWQKRWRLRAAELAETRIGQIALQQGFVLTHDQAAQCGRSYGEQRWLLRTGRWYAPTPGCRAPFPVEDRDEEAVLAATGMTRRRPGSVISARSAGLIHGVPIIPTVGHPFVTPELVAPGGHQRRQSRAHVRTAPLGDDETTTWFGVPVTTVPRTVVDLARLDRGQGLVAADAALRAGKATAHEIEVACVRAQRWPGGSVARQVLGLASPHSESPLESLTRLALHDRGVPAPELQVVIIGPKGWRARVDMAWRADRLILEVDGRVKYVSGELWLEKRRQEALEQMGYRVLRTTWAEVMYSPDDLAARVLRGLR